MNNKKNSELKRVTTYTGMPETRPQLSRCRQMAAIRKYPMQCGLIIEENYMDAVKGGGKA
jgi:hypothetical protein